METFCRAGFHADTAVNAGKGVAGPHGGFFIDADALGRAFDSTHTAKGAFFDIIDEFTPLVCKGRTYLMWIAPRGFPGHKISQHVGGHFKHKISLPYLSVQLMHGSIDKTMTGTSDRYCPGSMATSAGMLAKVGVRIRSLARFFLPSALI